MSDEKETCPKCGAESVPCLYVKRQYACGAEQWRFGADESYGELEPTELCNCRDRLSAAEREVERWREVATEARDKWSFDALVWMANRMLDDNYRADVFTGESGEPGPLFVSRMREALAALTPPAEGGGV